MQISVTFRQLEPSEALKTYVTDRLKKFKRYLEGPLEAHVVLGLEKFRHLADVTIYSNGRMIKGREENSDMYAAIDLVVDKIDMQLRKHRGKLREVKADRNRPAVPVAPAEPDETPSLPSIRRHQVEVPPLELTDAVAMLQTKGTDLLVFTDVNTGALSILYRRSDGGLALAEPVLG
jgi:putative sigma-54 modulation protein